MATIKCIFDYWSLKTEIHRYKCRYKCLNIWHRYLNNVRVWVIQVTLHNLQYIHTMYLQVTFEKKEKEMKQSHWMLIVIMNERNFKSLII